MKKPLPQVFMILMSRDPVSMYYRGRVERSWLDAGFNLEFIEAVTPETMQKERPLNFRMKESGRTVRSFTDTEKAVWYSHRKAWKLASQKSGPIIVIEHDVMLVRPIRATLFSDTCLMMGLCHVLRGSGAMATTAGGAYYITKRVARKMYDRSGTMRITTNSDAYIHERIDEYGSEWNVSHCRQIVEPSIGTTIDHGN
jgi:GR25 family glycosyltransferase involved in LPS biosynthesis